MHKSCSKRLISWRAAIWALLILLMGAIYMVVNERLASLDATMSAAAAATSEATQMNATREMLAHEIRLNAEQSEGKLALLFFIGKKENRIPVYGEMDRHNAALDQALARIRPLLTSTGEKKMLASLLALRETFRDNMQETVDALELNDREKAEALLSTTTRKNLQEIRSLIEHLVKEQQEAIAARQREVLEKKTETDAALSRSRAIIIGLGLGAAAVVLLLSLLLARKVAAPL